MCHQLAIATDNQQTEGNDYVNIYSGESSEKKKLNLQQIEVSYYGALIKVVILARYLLVLCFPLYHYFMGWSTVTAVIITVDHRLKSAQNLRWPINSGNVWPFS